MQDFNKIVDDNIFYQTEELLRKNTYINKYLYYKNLKRSKKKFIKDRKIGFVWRGYKPNHNNDIKAEEMDKNAIYYLYYGFNEYLAYYYAKMGHENNNKHCTYLLGVFYEFGIFVPISLPYAKYFYEQTEYDPLESIKSFEPKLIDIKLDLESNPANDLILGLGLISIDDNGIPNLNNISKGYELIEKASNMGYMEAKYILGCLNFDVNQKTAVIFEKGKLIHLSANQELAIDYLKEASNYGHELSLFVLAAYYYDNDEAKGMSYFNKLYEAQGYEFVKDIDSNEYSKKIVNIILERFLNKNFFYRKSMDLKQKKSMDLILSSDFFDSVSRKYEILKLEALFGIMNDNLYYIAYKNNISNFELDRLECFICLSNEEWTKIKENVCKNHRHLKAVDFCQSCREGLCAECANLHQIYSVSAEQGLPYCKGCYDRII